MATKTMSFSRSSSGYNAEDGDYLDFDPDSTLSFGSTYICTDFYIEITGGITSATTSARTHEMDLQLKFGSTWRTVWSGEQYLPAKGTTGYTITFSGTIPSAYQSEAATNGITDIRLQQSGDYALRGTNASGTLEVTYESIPATLTAPTNLKIVQNDNGTFTASWSASVGTNGSGSISYQLWRYDDDLTVSDKTTNLSVTCNIETYNVALQYYVIAYYSGVNASSAPVTVTFTDKLPVWYNGTQLTSITVVQNGVSTKITGLTIVKDGTSTKLF